MAVLLVLCTPAYAVVLRDVPAHTYADSIEQLVEQGIIQGYADGTFRPNQPINRAEFLKILMLAVYGKESFEGTQEQSSSPCFADFYATAQWFYSHACTAKQRGIINGYPDGTFRGEATVNLAEALKMSLLAWDLPLRRSPPEADEAEWYDPYMDAEASGEVFRTIKREPAALLTRGEAAELLIRLGQPIQTVRADALEQQVQILIQKNAPAICGNGTVERGEECDDGNTENDDGCSEICVVVPEPVRHGFLAIAQRPMGALSVTKGAKNVPLLAFDAGASRQSAYITQLKFSAAVGSLAHGTNYTLYVDADGDDIAEKKLATAVPQNNKLTFSQISIFVKEGYYTRVELRGDVQTSGDVQSFSVEFDASASNFVVGVDAEDGRDMVGIELNGADCTLSSICWIQVHTEDPRLLSFGGTQGSLFVTKDTTPVRSRQLLAGALSDVLLALEFLPTEEDVEMTKLSIGGGSASIDSLELYTEGASSSLAVARKTVCNSVTTGTFCADLHLVLPKDKKTRLLVRARVNADTAGGTSGDAIALSLTSSTAGNVAVEATGQASQLDLNQNDGNSTAEGEIFIGTSTASANVTLTGETHDVVLAKIASITNAHTDPDGTSVPSGETTFARFRFTASPHLNSAGGLNDVVLDSLAFSISATNVQFNSASFLLLNILDQTVTASCTGGTTGAFTVTCSGLENASVNTVIPQGESIELALRGTVTNTQVSNGTSTLQAQLQGLGSRSGGPITWNDEVLSFQWVDIGNSSVKSVLYRTF